MTPERWQQVEAILQEALDRPPVERAPFIESVCGGDEELKADANSLITALAEAGDFMEEPAIAQDAHVLLTCDSVDHAGREIGPYRTIRRLGAGGMGEVYLAQDTRLDRPIALKLLPAYFASDDSRLRRFQSEARAASGLNHPNILTIYEVGESRGAYFIATEFIEGQTLRELIRTQQLSLEEILDTFEQLASALSAAHSAGIVHRDIKPENIMRRPDGLLKVLDFGIAKLMEPDTAEPSSATRSHTEAGSVLGTVNYMSPEQGRGLSVDERTDIWSLGVVLYEMLSGRLPFSGATRMDTLVAIIDRDPAPLPERVSGHYLSARRLQTILDKCLAKDVGKRYRSVSDLLDDLKTVKEQRSSRFISQGRGLLVWPMIVALIVVIVATAGLVLYRRQDVYPPVSKATTPSKLYSEMNDRERFDFVSTQEHRISSMMSERAVKLNDDAVRVIKAYVDQYETNLNRPTGSNSEQMSAVYERARPYIPVIARSFSARKVPIIIGIYLPVIESAYRDCYVSPSGAKGLFQFMPPTAESYGVARSDMCNVEKMAPAAAHFFADRMAELGEDSGSITLVLLSYNRGAESVRDTLRQLRGTENYERNFWTLLASRESLDEVLRDESAGYVPRFFAAAIVGENPQTFGLSSPPLSSLAGATSQ